MVPMELLAPSWEWTQIPSLAVWIPNLQSRKQASVPSPRSTCGLSPVSRVCSLHEPRCALLWEKQSPDSDRIKQDHLNVFTIVRLHEPGHEWGLDTSHRVYWPSPDCSHGAGPEYFQLIPLEMCSGTNPLSSEPLLFSCYVFCGQHFSF